MTDPTNGYRIIKTALDNQEFSNALTIICEGPVNITTETDVDIDFNPETGIMVLTNENRCTVLDASRVICTQIV